MKHTKRIICAALVLVLALSCAVFAGCNTKSEVKGLNTNKTSSAASAAENSAAMDKLPETGYKNPYTGSSKTVEIDVKDYGKITVELDDTYAPLTVQNFLNLVNEGFYDGLTFHRVISGFMIQGGDPLGNGTGGSENQIKGEFSANGVENNLKHTRGVISMARSSDMNSASSQFFIMHEDAEHLDGQYASFGKVTSGMDVVDKIASSVKVEDSNGTVLKANQPVITSIKIIE